MTKQKLYFKVMNASENHRGFQYQDGLNVLNEEFDDNPLHHYCKGGLYFTDIKHVFQFLNFGIYVREIILPIEDPNFKMVVDENKYRANMIVLGKRYELSHVETYKMLLAAGADLHKDDDNALRFSAGNGYLEVVKYLVGRGAFVHAINDEALRWSAHNSHLEVVKFLISVGANVGVIHKHPIMEKLTSI